MKKIVINGGRKLTGEIEIGGSKNSVVALIPAAILSKDKVKIYHYPNISDVEVLLDILKELNVTVYKTEKYIEIDSSNIQYRPLTQDNMKKLRASYYFMGALIALFKDIQLTNPGGCKIGDRPIDMHIKGFKLLNCEVYESGSYIEIKRDILVGNTISFEKSSVGATVNVLLAAVLARGETVINNAAKEPEIVDVAKFLNHLGAHITGVGTSTIHIIGVDHLHGGEHTVIPDRIEAGTYLLFGAACGKNLWIRNIIPEHMTEVIHKLKDMHVNLAVTQDSICVEEALHLLPIDVRTEVFPGFPTDLQQIMTALLTQAEGESHVQETIYETRFKNCEDLVKMGASIEVDGLQARIQGPKKLIGCQVKASDLRGGASLILAALIAQGQTVIEEPEHIFRGYSDIIEKLRSINAIIGWIE